MYDYSTVNKVNLQKLHDFCPKIEELYMGMFAYDDTEATTATPEHPCGSPACLIGNGPGAGVPTHKDSIDGDGYVEWHGYSEANFIANSDSSLWLFAFDGEWPNCTKEAQARLKLIIDEKVPGQWDYSDRFAEGV